MNASTKHADQVRRVGNFVHQTMRDRGLPCQRFDLDEALLELSPVQLAQVHAAATDLARGADARETMGLLAALRMISVRAARHALSQAGVMYRADVLLPVATAAGTGPVFTTLLAKLRRADAPASERDAAAGQLLAMCGPVSPQDLLHESAPTLEPQPEVQSEPLKAPSPARDPSPAAPAAAPRISRSARQQVKVYGRTAALTWESAPVRARAGEESTPCTVMIEGAAANGDSTFDWSNKVIFACAQRELPQLLAVLLGWHEQAQFSFHGGKAGKELTVAHQEHGLFVRLREAGQTIGVPVTDPDRYALAMLVLNVMASNDASGDRQAVLAVCRDVMRPAYFMRGSSPD